MNHRTRYSARNGGTVRRTCLLSAPCHAVARQRPARGRLTLAESVQVRGQVRGGCERLGAVTVAGVGGARHGSHTLQLLVPSLHFLALVVLRSCCNPLFHPNILYNPSLPSSCSLFTGLTSCTFFVPTPFTLSLTPSRSSISNSHSQSLLTRHCPYETHHLNCQPVQSFLADLQQTAIL